MSYLVLFQSIFIIIVLILFFRGERKLIKKNIQLENLAKNYNSLKNEYKTVHKNTPAEKRSAHRVPLPHSECIITLIDFGNDSLEKLKNRLINGLLIDISVSGLKFSTPYELPVKYRIKVKVNFILDGEEFTLTGRIIRREDHMRGKSVSYGVQFIDISVSDTRRLNIAINNFEVANRIG